MCGVGGVVRADPDRVVDRQALSRMAAALRHRGPDGYGIAVGRGVGLVSTRLAIVDLPSGWQPMRLTPGGSVLVYNGEVYNHVELRAELRRQGVGCVTSSDTEIVLRLLERDGVDALARLNGQFALAWWEPDRRRLTLVRDRFGVRPLHYHVSASGDLTFGSEARAVFALGEVRPAPDFVGIDDVFSTWGPRPPRSAFAGINHLAPGSLLVWERGRVVAERQWWTADMAPLDADPTSTDDLTDLLRDSVRLRLRADVPVGTYLSGGLDSSVVTAFARDESPHLLRTFSLAFDDPRYDESAEQLAVAAALGTEHHVVRVGPREIADAFRRAVLHAEAPMIRTAPAPMALLAESAREHGITVIASGEGADELFWGYDLFKEVVMRRDALADPGASPGFDRLYPHLATPLRGAAWDRFFTDAGPVDDPLFSHQTRLRAMSAVRALYRPEALETLGASEAALRLRRELPSQFARWGPLERACWLELHTLLEPYLLAAQGDRAAMSHGVEVRYPFLDHRVFEHAVRLPHHEKLDGLRDKIALREVARALLPASIAQRQKQPYRAPEVAPFFGADAPTWVAEQLSPAAVRAAGVFDERRVAALVRRCQQGRVNSPRESMALVGVLSTQVWFEHFCSRRMHFEQEAVTPMVDMDLDDAAHMVGVVA